VRRADGRTASGVGLLAKHLVGKQESFKVVLASSVVGQWWGYPRNATSWSWLVGGSIDRSRRVVLHLLEKRRHVVSVHADPCLQPVVLFYQAGNLAFAVLGQTFLLVEQVANFFVLVLQQLILAVELGHDNGIGCIGRVLVGVLRNGDSVAALLLGLLENVNFARGHGKLDGHATGRLLALHDSHVVLQLVVGSRQADVAQDAGQTVDHGLEVI
jgi:hypothetical protein